MKKNIHIGYGDSATGCLLEAIRNHGLLGEDAIPSRDDFTQGPISDCLLPNGLNQRIEYWKSVDEVLGFRFEPGDFYNNSIKILEDIEADEVTIWVGDSCHDILATGWLISYLKDKDLKWYVVNLAEVAENDFPGDIPAVNLAMYTPERLKELQKYRKLMLAEDVAYYTSVWTKAAKENGAYRIKKASEIISVDADYFDEYILSHISSQFEQTSKIIGQILRDGRHRISDTTVEWNIRKMMARGVIENEGDLIRKI